MTESAPPTFGLINYISIYFFCKPFFYTFCEKVMPFYKNFLKMHEPAFFACKICRFAAATDG